MTTTHPPAHTLDALAAGDPSDPEVLAHVAACAPCKEYVDELSRGAAEFRAAASPAAFVAKVAARAEARPGPPRVVSIGWMAPVLAVAAALVLWMRAPSERAPVGDGPAVASTDQPRFKGEKVVAVIRERGGRQARLMGPFTVQAGDRVRVEVGVDREGPIVAGLLASDGAWTALLAPTVLEAGVHYSDLAARFDDEPTDAVLLVGAPDAVERARRTRQFTDVVAWRVTTDPPR